MKPFVLLCVLLFAYAGSVLACGSLTREYSPDDYFTYRVTGNQMKVTLYSDKSPEVQRQENVEAWAALTSGKIPLEAIGEAVYEWTLDEMKDIAASFRSEKSDNEFIAWLQAHRDREVMDFLLLAKECEELRARQNTAWYYYYPEDTICKQLSAVLRRIRAYRGTRLADRYAVQELRVYFGLRKYRECLKLWEEKADVFKPGVVKDLAVNYVTGAYLRAGQTDKARNLYIDNGQYEAALLCKENTDPDEFFDYVYRYNPDYPWLLSYMQSAISEEERMCSRYGSEADYSKLYQKAERIVKEGKCRDMAPWFYTAAFLSDKEGKKQKAWDYICKAEQTVGNDDLADAVRVLKTYLRAKYATRYTQELEDELYEELVWLDGKMADGLTPQLKDEIARQGISNHLCGFSQYYWSDMMRKILIGQVVPLCIRSGYKARALTYLNYADNAIFSLVGQVKDLYSYNEEDGFYYSSERESVSLAEYRLSTECRNEYDYANDFFFNLDSLGVNAIIGMVGRMQDPKCRLDSFLVKRSYTDIQYFYDIIGTHLIASMRYKEAVRYLKRVSEKFQQSRNVFVYCNVDPFTDKKLQAPSATYKLDFAREMVRLQQLMDTCSDPNLNAQYCLRYTKGLINSIDRDCWPLTCYFWGSSYCAPIYSQYRVGLSNQILAAIKSNKQRAFGMFTDKRKAALALYQWKMYKSAYTLGQGTLTAMYIKGHCDNLYDYQVRPAPHPSTIR